MQVVIFHFDSFILSQSSIHLQYSDDYEDDDDVDDPLYKTPKEEAREKKRKCEWEWRLATKKPGVEEEPEGEKGEEGDDEEEGGGEDEEEGGGDAEEEGREDDEEEEEEPDGKTRKTGRAKVSEIRELIFITI